MTDESLISAEDEIAHSSGLIMGAQMVIHALQDEVKQLHTNIAELMSIIGIYARRDAKESEVLLVMQAEVERLRVCVDRVAAHASVKENLGPKPESVPLFPNPFAGCTRETESPNKQAK